MKLKGAEGWLGVVMVLGKLPVPGRPTIWITVGQGPALAVGAGGGCVDIFTLNYASFLLSPSLWERARYRLKYCLKGLLNPKPTNQPTRLKELSVYYGPFSLKVERRSDDAKVLVNFQCRGVLQIWIIEGQGPKAFAVGAGGVVWIFFFLIYRFPFLSPPLADGPM